MKTTIRLFAIIIFTLATNIFVLGQDTTVGDSDDGLELGACYISPDRKLTFAGARFSLFYHDRDNEVIEIKGDKKGIAYRDIPKAVTFTNQSVDILPTRRFFLTSDGIIDQIGGEKRRSFGKKRFQMLLKDSQNLSMSTVGEYLYRELEAYQGKEIRRDDVSIFGFFV